ncbi:TerC family protein [Bradyrhizobium diazoefficiens]|jgi:YjbE family integral membrane protein|uniref:TerC family protein n=1 Tax=Bradyrhizobium TaxID=374 RepID=UPI001B8A7323|nr:MULTISPECIES: TerC family protein [Bradyrhizobium]MBR0704085.1 TerC family protein [Bradyrhizobium diazoefficiens]MBR0770700.1 TerC family protein [Bradyrhizobium diazoefficiens]MBR0927848.1 TerC family protein [Bradyrhizobium diazoefficiens]MCS3760435.1 YjbE family integral membrane protein [Bradyrhizobium centrosematis]MCS3771677.1 YjbE family integral membrane protein [Bradyrhizobium centrosematis]
MIEFITPDALTALLQVVLIDLVLAGDNAVVIGLAAAGLPAEQRRRAIIVGIAAATVLRIVFAGVATQLLQVIGLLLAGGVLLLWVCWKMWRELREQSHTGQLAFSHGGGAEAAPAQRKTFGQAAVQIVAADVSMSLDNVLAVAGAAREHPYILAFGLLLSVAMMGVAADLLGRVLQKHRWVAYVGLAIIIYVAFEMIYRGSLELAPVIASL